MRRAALTGYGAKTLPAVREGIEQDRFEEAARYIPITAAVLSAYCDRLDRAAAVLAEAGLRMPTAPAPIAVARLFHGSRSRLAARGAAEAASTCS